MNTREGIPMPGEKRVNQNQTQERREKRSLVLPDVDEVLEEASGEKTADESPAPPANTKNSKSKKHSAKKPHRLHKRRH